MLLKGSLLIQEDVENSLLMGGIKMKSVLLITLLLGLISPIESNANEKERCRRGGRYAPSHKCIPHEDEINSCIDRFWKYNPDFYTKNPHIKKPFSAREMCIRRIKVWG